MTFVALLPLIHLFLIQVSDADPMDNNRFLVARMLNHFTINGIHGTRKPFISLKLISNLHFIKDICMVFEVLGHDLLKLITGSKYRGIPLENVQLIIKQVYIFKSLINQTCNLILKYTILAFAKSRLLAPKVWHHSHRYKA